MLLKEATLTKTKPVSETTLSKNTDYA